MVIAPERRGKGRQDDEWQHVELGGLECAPDRKHDGGESEPEKYVSEIRDEWTEKVSLVPKRTNGLTSATMTYVTNGLLT